MPALRTAPVLLLVAAAVACNKVQANAPLPQPGLAVPVPDRRLHIPVPIEEIPIEAPPVAVSPPAGAAAPPPSPARPVVASPPPTTASPPSTPVPTSSDKPAPILQTSTDVARLEAQTRLLLDRAERDLNRVNQSGISPDAYGQFLNARSLVRQAKEAMRIRNWVHSLQLADKAATLAALLVKSP